MSDGWLLVSFLLIAYHQATLNGLNYVLWVLWERLGLPVRHISPQKLTENTWQENDGQNRWQNHPWDFVYHFPVLLFSALHFQGSQDLTSSYWLEFLTPVPAPDDNNKVKGDLQSLGYCDCNDLHESRDTAVTDHVRYRLWYSVSVRIYITTCYNYYVYSCYNNIHTQWHKCDIKYLILPTEPD